MSDKPNKRTSAARRGGATLHKDWDTLKGLRVKAGAKEGRTMISLSEVSSVEKAEVTALAAKGQAPKVEHKLTTSAVVSHGEIQVMHVGGVQGRWEFCPV